MTQVGQVTSHRCAKQNCIITILKRNILLREVLINKAVTRDCKFYVLPQGHDNISILDQSLATSQSYC